MDRLNEIVQEYIGMTPQDKGCNNWSEMQEQMVNELTEVNKREPIANNCDTIFEQASEFHDIDVSNLKQATKQ